MEIASSGNWSVGFMVAMGFFIVIALIFLFTLFGAFISSDWELKPILGFVALGAFVVLAIMAWQLFPWSAEYHQYREVSGQVEEVGERLVSSGENSMEEKYVVRFEGSDQEFRVDDTRGALVEPGGALTIKCIKTWDYNATDGYICKWGSYSAAE